MTRYAMIIDLDRCNGCNSCTVACKAENGTSPGIFWGYVLQKENGKTPNVFRLFLPVLCNHCENPACVDVCPTGASYQSDNGLVLIDSRKCIGCKTCITACPYGVRWFVGKNEYYYPGIAIPETADHEKSLKTVQKCHFCKDRIENGDRPKCVEVCPTRSRSFGDLDDKQSDVSELLETEPTFMLNPAAGTGPSVRYILNKKTHTDFLF